MTLIHLPVRSFRFYPADDPLGVEQKSVEIDPQRTALLLVDVYHAAESQQARHLVNATWDKLWWKIVDECMLPLVASARSIGVPLVYATNSSPNIAMERSPFGRALIETLGFDPRIDFTEPEVDPREYARGIPVQLVIPSQIAPQPGDFYVRKHTYSGFFETRLDSVLRNLKVETLLCAGFVADVCLRFTLSDAVFRGYRSIFFRDCTLATEFPTELDQIAHTKRTITWLESFLAPSALSSDFVHAAAQITSETKR